MYDKCALEMGDARLACQLDKALVNVGAMFLERVEGGGRVSTELDPRLAYDTGSPCLVGLRMPIYRRRNASRAIQAQSPSLANCGAVFVRTRHGWAQNQEAVDTAGGFKWAGLAMRIVRLALLLRHGRAHTQVDNKLLDHPLGYREELPTDAARS